MQRPIVWSTMALSAVLIAGCTTSAGAAPVETAEAPVAEAAIQAPSTVSATGEVVPSQWVDLAFPMNGSVIEMAVSTGDSIAAGDVIARLDDTDLRADVAEAEAAIAQAEANLALVSAGPSEAEIEAAENSLSAATARSVAAAARRDAMKNGVSQADVASAQAEVDEAQVVVNDLNGQLNQIVNTDPSTCSEEGGCIVGAYDTVTRQLQQAQLQLASAQAGLNDLLDGPNPDAVRVENARVWLSYAQVEAAQARLDYLKNLPFPADVEVAEAELAQAEVGLKAAERLLEQAVLVAPFDGTVTAIYVDGMQVVTSGQPIVQMSALDDLRVQTIDLTEQDVARISPGAPATVTFDALPDVEVTGEVLSIAARATSDTNGVMYRTVILLDEIPAQLRWGMTSFVNIDVD